MQAADTVQDVPKARPVIHPFAQIAAHYRARIKDGRLPPGTALPTIKKVAQEWGMSPPTAQRAFNLLKAEGLVRSEHGRGNFVVDEPPP